MASIAAHASPLRDRARSDHLAHQRDDWRVDDRLQTWRSTAADGDEIGFAARLRSLGLDLPRARLILQATPAQQELPSWTGLLNEVLHRNTSGDQALGPEHDLAEHTKRPIPFRDVLLPFAQAAIDRLSRQLGGTYQDWPANIRATLERALLETLASISGRVLLVEFRTSLACRQLTASPPDATAESAGTASAYRQFVREMRGDGLKALFIDYCVLARLMSVAIENWVTTTAAFLTHLTGDLDAIRATFLMAGDPAEVVGVQTGLSDPHCGGRTVIAVQFGSGTKIVYKPRNIDLDADFAAFIDGLNETSGLTPLYRLKTLCRGDYGWTAFVAPRGAETDASIRRFYRRTGMLLGLIYALNGRDFHFENIVACGDHPVAVDLETLFHNSGRHALNDPAADDATSRSLRRSVLQTNVLPSVVRRDKQYFEISALARSPDSAEEVEALVWRNVDTDAIDYRYARIKTEAANNLPTLDGHGVSPADYVGEICGGFAAIYRFLMNNKGPLLEEGGALHRVFRHEARFLRRATSLYDDILYRALAPERLSEGVDFSIQLDQLARPLTSSPATDPGDWAVLEAELDALWNLDIPKFITWGTGLGLNLDNGAMIARYFPRSAWDEAVERIKALDENDLRWQLSLISAAMEASYPAAEPGGPPGPTPAAASDMPATQAALLTHAIAIADQLRACAITSETGEPSWPTFVYLNGTDRFTLQGLCHDLYSGRSGIALFFAAVEAVAPGRGFGPLAISTLAPVRRWLERARFDDIAIMGLGGFLGLPSAIYGLVKVGELLRMPELLHDAGRAIGAIDRRLIEADQTYDVVGGAAGAILVLLACRAGLGDATTLPAAIACGEHLLAARRPHPSGYRTWSSSRGPALTGFAHGSSGIIHALLKLYQATGRRPLYDAAVEALAFERTEFVAAVNNWPDRRRPPSPEALAPDFKIAWCQGAPGIALARLAALHVHDTPEIRRDIRAALAASCASLPLPRDHLCCGNAGLIETLLVAGSTPAIDQAPSTGYDLATRIIARAQAAGSFAFAFEKTFVNPTLMQGRAGLGYQFLRLACPDRLPAVLLLE